MSQEALSQSKNGFRTPKTAFHSPKSAFRTTLIAFFTLKTTLYTSEMTFRMKKTQVFCFLKDGFQVRLLIRR